MGAPKHLKVVEREEEVAAFINEGNPYKSLQDVSGKYLRAVSRIQSRYVDPETGILPEKYYGYLNYLLDASASIQRMIPKEEDEVVIEDCQFHPEVIEKIVTDIGV